MCRFALLITLQVTELGELSVLYISLWLLYEHQHNPAGIYLEVALLRSCNNAVIIYRMSANKRSSHSTRTPRQIDVQRFD